MPSDQDDLSIEDNEATAEGGASNQQTKRLFFDLLARWHWIVLFVIIGLLCSAYYLSKVEKQYSATSTLLIKTQTSSLMSADRVEDVDLGSQEALNTTAAQLGNMELLQRVAARPDVRSVPGLIPEPVEWMPEWLREEEPVGAEGDPARVPPPPQLARRIASWMGVTVREYTRLLDITVTHPVPEAAKVIADAIAREYIAQISAAVTEGRSGTIELLVEESEQVRERLQKARSALATYDRALQAHEALEEQENIVDGLATTYLPAHPKMQTATSELDRVQSRFINEFQVASQSKSDRKYWQESAEELPDRNQNPDRYLRVARQQLLARIGVLNSEIESQTSVFNSMLTRIEESTINQGAEEASAEVNNPASLPGAPVSPNPNQIYAMGILGGFVTGLGLAFLLVCLDNKFHTVAQIASETGEPVLASIPEINNSHLESARKKYFAKRPELSGDAYKDWDPQLVFRPGTLETNYAEMYRVLRASVSLLGDESVRKSTAFTSAIPGEGKTRTSANFALAAAGQGHRTLLIDLDLRKPNVHRVFGMKRHDQPGATECLAGHAHPREAICSSGPEPNLDLILSGRRSPNPGELLDTGKLRDILAWAAEHYQTVVLDTAPLLAVPDTRIIDPLVDNLCLVARAEYVPKGAVHHALDTLRRDGSAPAGLVFNGFREKRGRIGQNYSYGYYRTSRYGRAYQYGYGSYGSYGSDDEEAEELKAPTSTRFDPFQDSAPQVETPNRSGADESQERHPSDRVTEKGDESYRSAEAAPETGRNQDSSTSLRS